MIPKHLSKWGHMKTIRNRWRGALGVAAFSIIASFHAPATFASTTWQNVRSTVPMVGLATDGSTYVAIAYNGIWTSSNLKSWQKLSLPSAAGTTYRDVIWDGSQFIAVGSGILTSPDGSSWSVRVKPSTAEFWSAITVSAGIYVVVGDDASTVERSTDGVHWTSVATGLSPPSPDTYGLSGIASNGSGFVSLGAEYAKSDGITNLIQDIVATSPDGVTWTLGTLPGPDQVDTFYQDVAWGNGTYVAGGFGGVYTSPDGIAWTAVDPSVGTQHPLMQRLAFLNGGFVGVGINNDNGSPGSRHTAVFTSADGVHWAIHDLELKGASSAGAAAILYTGSKYVEGGELGAYTSTDASTWTKVYTGPISYLGDCVLDDGAGQFVIPGEGGTLDSPDGQTWSTATSAQLLSPPNPGEGCGARGAGLYVSNGYSSNDGKSWTSTGIFANGVAWNGSEFAAIVLDFGTTDVAQSYTSSDGKTWTLSGTVTTATDLTIGANLFSSALAFLNGQWVTWGSRNSAPFVAFSNDAAHWTVTTSGLPGSGDIAGVAFGGGRYVAIGDDVNNNTILYTSTDAKTWSKAAALKSGTAALWQTLIYGNSEFMAGGSDNATGSAAFLRSTDGKTWTYSTDPATSEIYSIDWDGSRYVAASYYDVLTYAPPASGGSGGGSGGGGSGGGSSGGGAGGGGGGDFSLLCLAALLSLLSGRRFLS